VVRTRPDRHDLTAAEASTLSISEANQLRKSLERAIEEATALLVNRAG